MDIRYQPQIIEYLLPALFFPAARVILGNSIYDDSGRNYQQMLDRDILSSRTPFQKSRPLQQKRPNTRTTHKKRGR